MVGEVLGTATLYVDSDAVSSLGIRTVAAQYGLCGSGFPFTGATIHNVSPTWPTTPTSTSRGTSGPRCRATEA